MIVSFKDKGTEDLFDDEDTKVARKTLPSTLWKLARRKLDQLNAARELSDMRFPPGHRLEALVGNRKGQHSVRINDQYRICFKWHEGNAYDVEVTDYH